VKITACKLAERASVLRHMCISCLVGTDRNIPLWK